MNSRTGNVGALQLQGAQNSVGLELLKIAMGVFTPGALQVFRFSERVIASPSISKEGKAVAEIVGGLAVLYFFLKVAEQH
jgi:hypothetical protein